jgi:hypothetical protein
MLLWGGEKWIHLFFFSLLTKSLTHTTLWLRSIFFFKCKQNVKVSQTCFLAEKYGAYWSTSFINIDMMTYWTSFLKKHGDDDMLVQHRPTLINL